jgi:hypothetical protein
VVSVEQQIPDVEDVELRDADDDVVVGVRRRDVRELHDVARRAQLALRLERDGRGEVLRLRAIERADERLDVATRFRRDGDVEPRLAEPGGVGVHRRTLQPRE